MQTFEAFSFSGLLGQSNLIEPLLGDVATLGSSAGLNDIISKRVTFSPKPESLLVTTQLDQTLEPKVINRGAPTRTLENNRSLSQPAFFRSTNAEMDQLTGMAAGAPLVSATTINTRINFQPNDAPLPAKHIKDIGESYQVRSNGQAFGWVRQDSLSNATHVPLDIAKNTRDRNQEGVDQRLDTLIHMQGNNVPGFGGVKIPAAWEYAVPDGRYSVTVSVGDKSQYTDSTHQINVENVTAIRPFEGNAIHEYERATVQVEVTDGRLTIDAVGGNNTKLNFVYINTVSPGEHPSIAAGSSPVSRQTNVNRSAAVTLNVNLVDTGAGVDPDTLNANTVRLYRTEDNFIVSAASIGTSGGGDAIVFQPLEPLDANTHYTFRISSGVKDDNGQPFLPFTTTFSTGTSIDEPPPGVEFNKSIQFNKASSSLVMSPDSSKLYATDLEGNIRRWTVSSSGDLTNLQTLSLSQLAGRAIIGIAFDPANSNVLWISHNDPLFPQPAKDFTGKISKLTLQSGSGFNASIRDYVTGLPRSAKDHLSNSIAFGPDEDSGPAVKRFLYLTQGSNTAVGAPDTAWGPRGERLLTAAVLQIDPRRTPPSGGFNVRTEGRGADNYNPYAIDDPGTSKNEEAPVKIFATGTRNPYDLVWHSNGSLYVPTNGSAAKGNTPDDPTTSVDEGLTNVAVQNDYLFKVVKGGYYGHPNPKRQEYILNGGNPTPEKDPAEVVDEGPFNGYGVDTDPDSNYRGFAHDFGRNRSPNGAIEYMSDSFGGILKNRLLVAEYAAGDRILSLRLNDQGEVTETTPVYSNLTNPLDLVEDRSGIASRNGNLYVVELVNEETGEGRISLLKPV